MAVAAARLPRSFAPMLAKPGAPFDSDRHLYEVKWDGIRAVALVEEGGYRLLSRAGNDLTRNYPELAALARLPAGTIVDGEIVVLNEGRPDFEFVLRRDRRAGSPDSAATPACYLVFDLMYREFAPLTELPLLERRQPLADLVSGCGSGHIVLSDGFVGAGVAFYREVCDRNLEGVVAKRVDSRYLPGRRSDAWIKIKRRISYHCVVLGFLDKDEGADFQSLLIATEREPGSGLHYAGRVGTGFDEEQRSEINALLRGHRSTAPLLPPPADLSARHQWDQVCWVEPVLFCVVSCVELTSAGVMRAPVFEGLVRENAT